MYNDKKRPQGNLGLLNSEQERGNWNGDEIDEKYEQLGSAIVVQACKDYVSLLRQEKGLTPESKECKRYDKLFIIGKKTICHKGYRTYRKLLRTREWGDRNGEIKRAKAKGLNTKKFASYKLYKIIKAKYKRQIAKLEKFFVSDWFYTLSNLNGKEILLKLKRGVEKNAIRERIAKINIFTSEM